VYMIENYIVDHNLRVNSNNHVAIEINTSGKTKDCGRWYSSNEILERALFYNVDITFGSDAHSPDRVGDDFNCVKQSLEEIGFKEWVFFKQKRKVVVSL